MAKAVGFVVLWGSTGSQRWHRHGAAVRAQRSRGQRWCSWHTPVLAEAFQTFSNQLMQLPSG